MGLSQKAETAIRQYHMLERGGSVVVGVSGGPDSVALLHLLYTLREAWELTLTVGHINHNLRGEESDRDQRHVEQLAQSLGLPLRVCSADVRARAREEGLSVEEAAREIRYAAFAAWAGEDGRIATAHTLSDSMETVLFNLARGTGVRGLCGIPPVRGKIIRPLIGCTREEVLEYCHAQGLVYVTDSSNLSAEYSRNRIRHQVIPALETVNIALPRAMERMMRRMQEQWELTEALAGRVWPELVRENRLDRSGYLAQPAAVGDRLVQRLLEERGFAASAQALEKIRDYAGAGAGAVPLRGCSVTVDAHWISVCTPEKEIPGFCLEIPRESLEKGGLFPTAAGKRLKITPFYNLEQKNPLNFNKQLLKNALNYDTIKGNVILRSRREGDRMQPVGRGCTKSFKKLFNEAHIPPPERPGVALAQDSDGIIWAEGFGADRRTAAGAGTQRILLFEMLEEQRDGRTGQP